LLGLQLVSASPHNITSGGSHLAAEAQRLHLSSLRGANESDSSKKKKIKLQLLPAPTKRRRLPLLCSALLQKTRRKRKAPSTNSLHRINAKKKTRKRLEKL
jgi:hypothetical protein